MATKRDYFFTRTNLFITIWETSIYHSQDLVKTSLASNWRINHDCMNYLFSCTSDQLPTVQAKGHISLTHDFRTGGFSLMLTHSSSFNATCSSLPELRTQSTERIEIPFPHVLEHFCQGPLHQLRKRKQIFNFKCIAVRSTFHKKEQRLYIP